MAKCNTCKTLFDDGLHADCGGDCRLCMVAAGDPNEALAVVPLLLARNAELVEALKALLCKHTELRDMAQPALVQARAALSKFQGENHE